MNSVWQKQRFYFIDLCGLDWLFIQSSQLTAGTQTSVYWISSISAESGLLLLCTAGDCLCHLYYCRGLPLYLTSFSYREITWLPSPQVSPSTLYWTPLSVRSICVTWWGSRQHWGWWRNPSSSPSWQAGQPYCEDTWSADWHHPRWWPCARVSPSHSDTGQ